MLILNIEQEEHIQQMGEPLPIPNRRAENYVHIQQLLQSHNLQESYWQLKWH